MAEPDRIAAIRQSYDAIADEYAKQFFGELAHKPYDRALLECFAEQVRELGIVADIGCGPGHIGRYLHDLGLPVIGVDLSPTMVEVARSLSPDVTFMQGSMLDLDVPDGAWGGITAFYSIIHIPPERLDVAFGEFVRVLVPGGLVLIAFHLGDEMVNRDDWFGHKVDVDSYFHPRSLMEDRLCAAGFTIEATLEREPKPSIEYPSRRCYIFARRAY